MGRLRILAALLATSLAPAAGAAQAAPPSPAAAPLLAKLSGSALQPGSWTYASSVTQNGQSQSMGTRTLTVSSTTYHGAGAWLIVESRDAGAMRAADTLYVTRADFAPLHRALQMGVLRIENDFSRDSVTGKVTLPQGTVPLSLPARPGLMVNGNMLEVALQLVPLRMGWAGSADMLVMGPQGAAAIPVRLDVTAEERVTVPAGTFDSWIAVVKGDQVDQKIWLAKDSHRIVKVTFSVPQVAGAVAETVLTGTAK